MASKKPILGALKKAMSKAQESKIDKLYVKKKAASMSGDMKKKQRLDKKITRVRRRSLSEGDMID